MTSDNTSEGGSSVSEPWLTETAERKTVAKGGVLYRVLYVLGPSNLTVSFPQVRKINSSKRKNGYAPLVKNKISEKTVDINDESTRLKLNVKMSNYHQLILQLGLISITGTCTVKAMSLKFTQYNLNTLKCKSTLPGSPIVLQSKTLQNNFDF